MYPDRLTADDPSAYLGSPDVARLVGTTTSTVARWARAGRIPAYRFGHFLKFRPEDVEAFVAAARVDAGGDR